MPDSLYESLPDSLYIRNEIKKIHRSYEALEFKEELLYRDHKFPYEVLLIHERDRKLYYHPYLREDIEPSTVLNGFVPRSIRTQEVSYMNGKYNIRAEQIIINEASNLGNQINRLEEMSKTPQISESVSSEVQNLAIYLRDSEDIDIEVKKELVSIVQDSLTKPEDERKRALDKAIDITGKITVSAVGGIITRLVAGALGLG